jgi:CBS domain containing-hemolysin-like protein
VSENAPLSRVLDIFLEQHQHIAMVINEYGESKGLVSLEDLVETLLGEEIVDEGDKVADMRELARIRWQRRAKRMGIEV